MIICMEGKIYVCKHEETCQLEGKKHKYVHPWNWLNLLLRPILHLTFYTEKFVYSRRVFQSSAFIARKMMYPIININPSRALVPRS